MTELLAGFALGLAGSVHCAAMCGPLVLAVRPARTPGRVMLYHAARVSMYAAAGLIAGAIGQTSHLLGLGRIVSVAAGLALLVFAVRRAGLTIVPSIGDRVGRQLAQVMTVVRRAATDRPLIGVMAAGAMNALLPCGLVYAAIAAATALGTTASAVSFMVSFGLGTVPMLAVISLLAKSVPPGTRSRLRFATPIALGLVGVLLIARGTVVPHTHAMNADRAAPDVHVHSAHHAVAPTTAAHEMTSR